MKGWFYTVRPLGRLKLGGFLSFIGVVGASQPSVPSGVRVLFALIALAGIWIAITGLWWSLRLIGTLFRRPPR